MKSRAFQPSLNDIPEDDHTTQRSQSRSASRNTSLRQSMRSSSGASLRRHPQKREYENLSDAERETIEKTVHNNSEPVGTLERLAQKLSKKGSKVVSEIIGSFDKNDINSIMYGYNRSRNQIVPKISKEKSFGIAEQPSKLSSELAKIKSTEKLSSGDESPELIKPSVLRSIRNDPRRKSFNSSATFDNFRDEMAATFNMIKNNDDGIDIKEESCSMVNNSLEPKSSMSGDHKVRRWLEDLNNGEEEEYEGTVSLSLQENDKTGSSWSILSPSGLGYEGNSSDKLNNTPQEIKESSSTENTYEEIKFPIKNNDENIDNMSTDSLSEKDSLNSENLIDRNESIDDYNNVSIQSGMFARSQSRSNQVISPTLYNAGYTESQNSNHETSYRTDNDKDNYYISSNISSRTNNSDRNNNTVEPKPPALPPKSYVKTVGKNDVPTIPEKSRKAPAPALPVKRQAVPPLPSKHSKTFFGSNPLSTLDSVEGLVGVKPNIKHDIKNLTPEAAATILHGTKAQSIEDSQISSDIKKVFNRVPSEKQILRKSSKRNFHRTGSKRETSEQDRSSISSSEERVRGQFILAPEGLSPSRGSFRASSSRSGSESYSSSSKLKLCQCAKSELEKHFIDKGKKDADTIKRYWRKMNVDSSVLDPDKEIDNNDISDQIIKSVPCKRCNKSKQEDSGYQSSGSYDRTKTPISSACYDSSCSIDLDTDIPVTNSFINNDDSHRLTFSGKSLSDVNFGEINISKNCKQKKKKTKLFDEDENNVRL